MQQPQVRGDAILTVPLSLRFRELVRTLLADHPAHLDPPSLAYFMHSFCDTGMSVHSSLSLRFDDSE